MATAETAKEYYDMKCTDFEKSVCEMAKKSVKGLGCEVKCQKVEGLYRLDATITCKNKKIVFVLESKHYTKSTLGMPEINQVKKYMRKVKGKAAIIVTIKDCKIAGTVKKFIKENPHYHLIEANEELEDEIKNVVQEYLK
ncbi:uncharacterized protein LOC144450291 [Glandiceps talaboti]